MSCFPYPRDADVESIRVPLIARTQYSITGQTNFLDFFERALDAETQKIEAAESDGQESTSFSPIHWLASAVQSWLFFGIASEALGRNIRHEEFAGADPDGPHLFIDLRIPEWFWRELKARRDELDDSLTAAEFEAKRAQLKKIYESAQISVIHMDFLANSLDDDRLTKISSQYTCCYILWLMCSILIRSMSPRRPQAQQKQSYSSAEWSRMDSATRG